MYPKGIIYKSGKSFSHGEINLHPKYAIKVIYHIVRTFGAGLIAFTLTGIIFSFWPIVKEEYLFRFVSNDGVQISKFGDLLSKSNADSFGLDPYFSIYISKINAKANIVPNVDAGNPVDYLEALTKGVAHAKGTNFPGQGKLIYLFSHSTDSPLNFVRYNSIFYLLNKLEKGDMVIIFFMNNEYKYVVENKFVASKRATSQLIDDGSGEKLVLQTCDPPGTSINRLVVVARPVK